jgi:alpha-L-fucosidase
MIGAIFHLGLYSIYAFDDPTSAKRRHAKSGSECYLERLRSNRISGCGHTQKYHEVYFGNQDYYNVKSNFDCTKILNNMESWFQLARNMGAEYTIITSKHYDGFCLWPTITTKHCVDMDIIQEFKNYAKKYDMKFGLYYSLMEFTENPNVQYIDSKLRPQLIELLGYQPDILWLDGHWKFVSNISQSAIEIIIKRFKECIPHIQINDRICNTTQYKTLYADPKYLGLSTYRTYTNRYPVPKNPVKNIPWEYATTIGLSWGYNAQQEDRDYKTGQQLFNLYQDVKEKEGNFLINFGVDKNGCMDKREVKAIEDFIDVMINEWVSYDV